MTLGKTLLTIMIAAFFICSGLLAAAGTWKDTDSNWAKKAEDSFYLNPGLAKKLLTEKQWDKYEQKMNSLPPDQLSSFRVDMHRMLMQEARDRAIEVSPRSLQDAKHIWESQSGIVLRMVELENDARLLLITGSGSTCAGNTDMGTTGNNTIGPNWTTPSTGTSNGQLGTQGSQAAGATGDFGSAPETGNPGQFPGDQGIDSDLFHDRGF
jgi:hypothetical protein